MIKEALIKKLEGDIAVAQADLRTFLAQPIGVAEHIDYVITAEKKLEALANAQDKLSSLKDLLHPDVDRILKKYQKQAKGRAKMGYHPIMAYPYRVKSVK